MSTGLAVDRDRLGRLITREAARLEAASGRSAALYRRAARSLAGGVASDHQWRDPWPLYLTTGHGAVVTDVDGVRRVDFHNGFGATVHGHGHPRIAAAVAQRAACGAHLGVPTDDAVAVAEELARRWELPLWRFTSSGTEATMAALRLLRAAAGREVVVTAQGAYHGHAGLGPHVTVPFNDAGALAERLDRLAADGRPAAAVLLEPAFVLGVVVPAPGYLQAVREVTRERGILLAFDEVKSGLSVGPAGAAGRWSVRPDLVTVGKALGGGLPAAAIGATRGVMDVLARGAATHVGTFNGSAVPMAAARVTVESVLTAEAFTVLDDLGRRLAAGCRRVLAEHGLPGAVHAVGARGCVVLGAESIADADAFAAVDDAELGRLAWLIAANRGVHLTPARPQQWTLSVAHTAADADVAVAAFAAFVEALTRQAGLRVR